MRETDFMELVWENGEVLIRGLSSKNGVAAESAHADPISGASSLTKQRLVDSNIVQVKKSSVEDLEGNGNFMARKMSSILPNSKPQKESVADEQSEAVPNSKLAQDNRGFKGSPEQIVASSSFCSRGASNCPAYTLQRYEEDTDDLTKDTEMEELEEKTQGTKGSKRKKKTEVHNLSERKRRDKINKKMRALKELIPNCNKVDKASMLDEAIEYLRNLKFQVQMMSIGNRVYMPPMMFPSPSAMQHVNAQHMGGFSPMMGMRMQMGLGCGAPPQFQPPLMQGTAALPGNPEARLNMFGFPNEVLLRSMLRSPFVYPVGSFTPQSVQPYGAGSSQSAAATVVAGQVDLPAAANL